MLRFSDGHFRNRHAPFSGVAPETVSSGEKKGVLPCDKAPLKSLQNDLSDLTVTFFEALNTSCGVNQFLLAGVERVAG